MTTGATIKVSQPNEAILQTQERVLTLMGNVHAVDAAQNEVCRKLAVAPVGQQIRETDYKVLKQPPMPQQGHYQPMAPMGGAMGWMPQWMPQQGQRHVLPPAAGSGPLSYKQFMGTLADDVSPEEAQRQYQDYLRTVGAEVVRAMSGGGGGGGGKGPGGGAGAITHQLPLPDKMVSGIIGKGGLIIKEIISRSGAEVKISQKDPNNVGGERVVTIVGTPDSVAAAQRLVSERCREIEQQITRSAATGFPPAPAPANSFAPPPPFGYDSQQQLGYMHGMPQGYGASQFSNAPGFGAAAQQQPYGYACQPPATGSTPW